ncbi:MAG: hypothetical protein Q8N26_33580 [Myxococcales bacterium]|nr:hypothetical protein [Myxococcales bacterium]
MRSFLSSLLIIIVAGCGPAPTIADVEPDPVVTPQPFVWRHPTKPVSSFEMPVSGMFTSLGVEAGAGFLFGLHEGYPTEIVLEPAKTSAIRGCGTPPGHVTSWNAIGAISGDAAAVSLAEGRIRLSLQRPGRLEFELDGSVDGILCPGSLGPASVRLKQKVSVQVTRVSAFKVVRFGGGCDDSRPVIPEGTPVSMPQVWAVSDAGELFYPTNAVPAATLVATSATGLKTTPIEGFLEFAPGPVEFAVETSLPTLGLRGFEVVESSAVTSMEAKLVLQIAASKGSVPTPLTEGASVVLFKPEGSAVSLDATGATMTSKGRLCDAPPPHWFETTSSTPGVCSPAKPLDYEGPVKVSLHGPGTCAFETRITGSAVQWKASFTATVR